MHLWASLGSPLIRLLYETDGGCGACVRASMRVRSGAQYGALLHQTERGTKGDRHRRRHSRHRRHRKHRPKCPNSRRCRRTHSRTHAHLHKAHATRIGTGADVRTHTRTHAHTHTHTPRTHTRARTHTHAPSEASMHRSDMSERTLPSGLNSQRWFAGSPGTLFLHIYYFVGSQDGRQRGWVGGIISGGSLAAKNTQPVQLKDCRRGATRRAARTAKATLSRSHAHSHAHSHTRSHARSRAHTHRHACTNTRPHTLHLAE